MAWCIVIPGAEIGVGAVVVLAGRGCPGWWREREPREREQKCEQNGSLHLEQPPGISTPPIPDDRFRSTMRARRLILQR
jgi:hypothetical protein